MLIARLDKVSLRYGLSPLLEEADLQVSKGERVCVLGRNGAGKSSLMRTIATLQEADSGSVFLDDLDVLKSKTRVRNSRITGWAACNWCRLQDQP